MLLADNIIFLWRLYPRSQNECWVLLLIIWLYLYGFFWVLTNELCPSSTSQKCNLSFSFVCLSWIRSNSTWSETPHLLMFSIIWYKPCRNIMSCTTNLIKLLLSGHTLQRNMLGYLYLQNHDKKCAIYHDFFFRKTYLKCQMRSHYMSRRLSHGWLKP